MFIACPCKICIFCIFLYYVRKLLPFLSRKLADQYNMHYDTIRFSVIILTSMKIHNLNKQKYLLLRIFSFLKPQTAELNIMWNLLKYFNNLKCI